MSEQEQTPKKAKREQPQGNKITISDIGKSSVKDVTGGTAGSTSNIGPGRARTKIKRKGIRQESNGDSITIKDAGKSEVAGIKGGTAGSASNISLDGKGKKGGKKGGAKVKIKEASNINSFLRSLTEKNYAEANKYLHAVLGGKIKNRIRNTAN